MASTYLTKANPTANTDSRKKGTISFWFKRCGTGATQYLYTEASDGNNAGVIYLSGSDTLNIISYDGGTSQTQLSTTAKYRDTNGWYHFCFSYDSTLGTADDRQKLWINGEQITSFSTRTNPSQDGNFWFGVGGNNYPIKIGINHGSSDYFNGYMSHFHRVDSQALNASVFGSTDSETGEWKITTSPSITYTGTSDFNFFILKNGNSVTDQSGEGNDLTVGGGTLTKSEDNPSNVFATMNPLDNQNQGSTFTMGNTKLEWNTNNKNNFATLAMNKGKFYWEIKYANNTGGSDAMIGMSLLDTRQGDDYPGHDSTAWSYYASNGNKYHSGGSSYGDSYTTNDIIGVAFDADTRTLWFSKNGTWQNSATISEIAAGTTTNAAWTGMGSAGDWFIPCMSGYDGNKAEFNFGNGYFSTTAISSEGTNASGIGKFEYDVPTNFTALSTKGLNE